MERTRRGAVATLVAGLLLWTSGIALADGITVSVDTEEGTRDIHVTDLAGASLAELALADGVPKTFRVAVVDDRLATAQQAGFTVEATMTNLYRVAGEGHDWDTRIPAGNVAVTYATDPLGVSNLLADVRPSHVLSTTTTLSCNTLASLLGLSLLDLLGLLSGLSSTICSEIDGLVIDATDGVQVAGLPVADVDLADLGIGGLPIVPQTGETGAFASPSFEGIGAGDPGASGAPAATARPLLVGTLNPGVAGDLTGLVAGLLDGSPLVGGEDALTDVATLIDALRESGSSEIKAFGDILAELSGSQQVDAIHGTLAGALAGVGLDDILALTGTYQTLPRLTVTTGDAPGGAYEGTLTITLQ